MHTIRRLTLITTGALLVLATACAAPNGATAAAQDSSGLGPVLFLGDSVAEGQALPMAAAFGSAGVDFRSLATTGGGNVVGPFAEEGWRTLPGEITSSGAGTVIYQPTTYDWGTAQEQQAAYRRLLTTVTDAGASLVFVTTPPIQPDEFYRDHMAELERTTESARAVAEGSAGRAVVLDASEVWGATYQQSVEGRTYRSSDGIHTCPQGAARFTVWLLDELAALNPGFTPPAPEAWANLGWADDENFRGC